MLYCRVTEDSPHKSHISINYGLWSLALLFAPSGGAAISALGRTRLRPCLRRLATLLESDNKWLNGLTFGGPLFFRRGKSWP